LWRVLSTHRTCWSGYSDSMFFLCVSSILCSQVTHPLLKVTDICPAGAVGCSGDQPQFILGDEAHSVLTGASNDTVYDLGFQKVACNVSGNLQLSVSNDSSLWYFNLLFFNARVAVSEDDHLTPLLLTPFIGCQCEHSNKYISLLSCEREFCQVDMDGYLYSHLPSHRHSNQ
jgi:hypothetical protein